MWVIPQSINIVPITMYRIISTLTPMSNKLIVTFTNYIRPAISFIVKTHFADHVGILKINLPDIQFCCYLV